MTPVLHLVLLSVWMQTQYKYVRVENGIKVIVLTVAALQKVLQLVTKLRLVPVDKQDAQVQVLKYVLVGFGSRVIVQMVVVLLQVLQNVILQLVQVVIVDLYVKNLAEHVQDLILIVVAGFPTFIVVMRPKNAKLS